MRTGTFRKTANTHDQLIEGFAAELAEIDTPLQVGVQEVSAATVVGLVIKCAEQLEGAGLDAGAADEVLAEVEGVLS